MKDKQCNKLLEKFNTTIADLAQQIAQRAPPTPALNRSSLSGRERVNGDGQEDEGVRANGGGGGGVTLQRESWGPGII